jgi:hypothetical protein
VKKKIKSEEGKNKKAIRKPDPFGGLTKIKRKIIDIYGLGSTGTTSNPSEFEGMTLT